MNGYEVAQLWCACKAHYLSKNYNIVRYQWKFNLSEESFRLRRDRFLLERISREYDEAELRSAIGFYLYDNPKAPLKGLIRPNAKVEEAIMRRFKLYYDFDEQWPDLVKQRLDTAKIADLLIKDEITPEIAIVLFEIHGWPETTLPIRKLQALPKYSAFVAYDKAMIAQITMKHMRSAVKEAK